MWQTYGQVQKRRANVGCGLIALHESVGITGNQYGIGLWCQNRPEWQIIDLACTSQAVFSVSIYDTLGPDTTEYIINHASLTCVASSLSHIPTLLKLASRCPTLKIIVSLDSITTDSERPGTSKADLINALAQGTGIQVLDLAHVEALGEASPRPLSLIHISEPTRPY